ncbi:MAG: hypothetical protein OHK0046_31590 [Anaerolineae bacterium]
MQNSNNQPLLSDSEAEHTGGRANGTPVYENGHRNGAYPLSGEAELVDAFLAEDADVLDDATIDPVTEPEFLDAIDPETGELRLQEPHPARQPAPLIGVPHPSESTVMAAAEEPRSLRLQLRYLRTLIFAAWLFARLIFWQVYAVKLAPDYVTRTNTKRFQGYAREYSRFAAKLGGVYIKLGQFISTRVDIFPEAIIQELEGLQDEVPTIPFNKIEETLIRELGSIDAHFVEFNRKPIAAASLGQAHRARLKNGDKVVVKVQRPGIRAICFTDLDAMQVIAHVAMRFRFISRRCDAPALVEEFGRVFLEELSYKHEAYNADRFMEMFKNDMGVYIPAVYHEHSTDQVLTLEDVTTIKISDYAALERAGISRKAVAKRLMDTYLRQIFDEYHFHADPHPGNLFIYPLPVENEQADFGEKGRPFYLIFIDFGMTGTLTKEIADGMVSTLSAVINRDARQLVQSYIKLGFILPGADVERIVSATEAAFNQVWGMSMTDMRDMDFDSMKGLAEEFGDLMLSMPFYIPQDFIYLGRTLSILSGMATSLDPTFNPWSELQPYTEVLIARGFGLQINKGQFLDSRTVIQNLLAGNGTGALRTIGQELVRRTLSPVSNADDVMKALKEGDIHIVAELSMAHRQQLKKIEKESRRTGRSVFFGSLLIASTLLYTSGDVTLAVVGYAICGLTLIIGFLKD